MSNNKDLSDRATSQLAMVLSNKLAEPSYVRKGKEIFKKIITDSEKFYMIFPFKIGDTQYPLTYGEALRVRAGKIKTVIVLKKSQEMFAKFYSHVYESVILENDDMFYLTCYIIDTQQFKGDNYIFAYAQISRNWNWETLKHPPADLHYSMYEMYKWIFDLPQDTPITPMKIEENLELEKSLVDKYKLDKQKTIIMVPCSYSLPQINLDFWRAIVYAFEKKGYNVYTNVGYVHEQPIPGTAPIYSNYEELFFISRNVKSFVCLRSGITDILAAFGAPMIVINHDSSVVCKDLNDNSAETGISNHTIQIKLTDGMTLNWILLLMLSLLEKM